ncbi:hypothetical protein [Polaromonas aquatica]|uniref:hypothetical protein n=1 Tax=Polaromonas aquatica TaxID=332657 RepID=UPI003D64F3F0
MPRQLFFRHIPVLLLAILLAEFALHWWPWEEINAMRTGNRSWGSHGWAAVQLHGLHLRFLAVLAVCFGIALHVIRVVTPPDAQASQHFTPVLMLAIGSYVLAQALWLMPINDYRLGVKLLPYKLMVALVFKVCAVISSTRCCAAVRSRVLTRNGPTPSRPKRQQNQRLCPRNTHSEPRLPSP